MFTQTPSCCAICLLLRPCAAHSATSASQLVMLLSSPNHHSRHLAGFMQPGCTIELLPVPACQLRQFDSLNPADLLQFPSGLRRKVLVNCRNTVRILSENALQK